MTIFIQVAAYRDSELGPTLLDCLSKAKWPNQLRFGLCIQDDLNTDYGVDFSDSRFRIVRVPWQDSQGVCWARRQTQSLHEGEEFTLQLDSHHRFAEHWDELLLNDLERCNSQRPILSTYPGSYSPDTNKCALNAPNKILISRFDHNKSLKRYPLAYKPKSSSHPIPARFIAAGFLFTVGEFCEDVPYDARLYFAGEEPSLTLRAYTHGYDIFHPQHNILWHEYVRESKPKHWFDHAELNSGGGSQKSNEITRLENNDMTRFYSMLENKDQSKFGLGSLRSVHDYERFAGLDFTNHVVHQSARLGADPAQISESDWQVDNDMAISEKRRIKSWFTRIDLNRFIATLESAKFGIVSYFDRDDQMIERVTLKKTSSLQHGLYEQKLESAAPPAYWVLTGFTQRNQWEQIGSKRVFDYRLLA